MNNKHKSAVGAGILTSFLLVGSAQAGVSPQDANALKNGKLTPLGAEKAGNADGSISAWTGGMTSDPVYSGGKRDHLFKNDKPLFSITSANMKQYADQLSEGVKAMLAKYPDSYRLDVYKTERTAAAPQWVYDNTYQNALNGKLVEGSAGPHPSGVYGGTPFPIPQSGDEIVWNHELGWRGQSWLTSFSGYLVTADGARVLTITCATCENQMPYYFKGSSVADFEQKYDGVHSQFLLVNAGPPIRAGEGIVAHYNIDSGKDEAWVYLTGQRRTRKLPNACCDTPTPATAGVMSFDDLFVIYGRTDRFDWKLVGKKEMYVPYNDNQFLFSGKDEDTMSAHHLNPDKLRWEKHRVWVVDATLASGQRHVVKRGRYYFDEDNWMALLADRYDSNDQLWKTNWELPFAAPDIPAVASQTFGFYDLLSSAWYLNGALNSAKTQFTINEPILPASFFTPENMAAMGIR